MNAELWHASLENVREREKDALVAKLTAAERARYDALVFPENRLEFAATRALARFVLARWLDVPAAGVEFTSTKYGQPLLRAPSNVRFNLTNTIGLVACVVARSRDVGIDAESRTSARRILDVAPTVFTNAERRALSSLSDATQEQRALELWTYKEAYMKARGLGMSLAPERFAIVYGEEGPKLDVQSIGDSAQRWELSTFTLEGHVVSTCMERREGETLDIHTSTIEELAR